MSGRTRRRSSRVHAAIRNTDIAPRNVRRGNSIASSTSGFPSSKGIHSELMTQRMRASGQARRKIAAHGIVWTTSPSELGLTMRTSRGTPIGDSVIGRQPGARATFPKRVDPPAVAAVQPPRSCPAQSRYRTRSGEAPRAACPDSRDNRQRASLHHAAGRRCRH